MKILITIPHIFKPTKSGIYSSRKEEKRVIKTTALDLALNGNIKRHGTYGSIHASLGKGLEVVTRGLEIMGNDIDIQVYTIEGANLLKEISISEKVQVIELENIDPLAVAAYASKRAIEQYRGYDIVAYMEDDILIEDRDFFDKVLLHATQLGVNYILLPHRVETDQRIGDVILSGDPDGGRKDLFWDTGEMKEISALNKKIEIYRAVNPHSGCYFLSQLQARILNDYWELKGWRADFQFAGPLEQAATGVLLPTMKVMKTQPRFYRYFCVRHMDSLWLGHRWQLGVKHDH